MNSSIITGCVLAFCLFGSVIAAGSQREEDDKKLDYQGNTILQTSDVPRDGNKGKYIYYVSGYDYDNRPIIVLEWGRWDIRVLTETEGDGGERFVQAAGEFSERVKNGYFSKKGNNDTEYQDEVVGIIDFDGLNLRQIATAKSLKLFIRSLAQLEVAYRSFSYGYIVNATPLVHQMIHASKPYMGKFLERMEIYGTNSQQWIPKMLKKIPRTQLHAAYGGKPDFRPVAVFSLI